MTVKNRQGEDGGEANIETEKKQTGIEKLTEAPGRRHWEGGEVRDWMSDIYNTMLSGLFRF